jgi:hypothetical protein
MSEEILNNFYGQVGTYLTAYSILKIWKTLPVEFDAFLSFLNSNEITNGRVYTP